MFMQVHHGLYHLKTKIMIKNILKKVKMKVQNIQVKKKEIQRFLNLIQKIVCQFIVMIKKQKLFQNLVILVGNFKLISRNGLNNF
jgi:hypothetical protein